jgi:RimJ/RimL family protein N-acetyltransferase
MKFRTVIIKKDLHMLLKWRNDPLTRKQSHRTKKFVSKDYRNELKSILEDPNKLLFIVEENNKSVGIIRADKEDSCYELSWTVAPNERGKGIGTRMLMQAVKKIKGNLRAEIKEGNGQSITIAEKAGFICNKKEGNILYYTLTQQ